MRVWQQLDSNSKVAQSQEAESRNPGNRTFDHQDQTKAWDSAHEFSHLVLVYVNGLDFEIDSDGGGLFWVEGIVGESQEERRLANAALANDEQLERCEEGVAVHRHGALFSVSRLKTAD